MTLFPVPTRLGVHNYLFPSCLALHAWCFLGSIRVSFLCPSFCTLCPSVCTRSGRIPAFSHTLLPLGPTNPIAKAETRPLSIS